MPECFRVVCTMHGAIQVLCFTFFYHQHKAAGMKIKLSDVNGCNVHVFWNEIPPLESYGQAGVGTRMPLLSYVKADCWDAPANLLGQYHGCIVPCTTCFNCRWVEHVGAAEPGIPITLVLCCLLGCCSWLGRCVADMRLGIRVRYCHIPSHRFSFGPGQKSSPIRQFVVVPSGWRAL